MKPSSEGFEFHVRAQDGKARRSTFVTPHAVVELPTFMPVGTQGTVKTLTPEEVAATGAQIVLGNTYHLWVRPGPDVVAHFGGLHAFSKWPHAMLTDSGGFQAFSLSANVKLTEDGFTFRSHLDGQQMFLSPEEAVRIQGLIGADIQMQLDVCSPGNSDRIVVEGAVARTTRWAKRAIASPRPRGQALFGIVQGACFPDLRRDHAKELAELPFDGIALGGFSVGEPIPAMYEALDAVAHEVDPERPRYLMGVGTPQDLLIAVGLGIDMFDCVLPTRNARNGQALTRFGKITIKNARYRDDKSPLDPECTCPACAGGYARGYLRHLFIAGEILALRLISAHNLHFYGELMHGARVAIEKGNYVDYQRSSLDRMGHGDLL